MRILRNILVPFAAAALLLSCHKEEGKGTWKLLAGVDPQQTRTSLGPKGGEGTYPVLWEEGDVIAVNGAVSRALDAAEAGSSSATFTFDAKPAAAAVYNVLYPGSSEDARVTFPAEQVYVPETFCTGAVPMYGHMSNLDGGVSLRSCAAVIRFVIKGDVTLSAMDVRAPGGERISGAFSMGKDGSGALNGILTPLSGATSRMAYSFGEGLELDSEGKTLVFTVPGGTYSRGIRAELAASDGKKMALAFVPSGTPLPSATVCAFPAIAFLSGKEIVFTSTDAMSGEVTDLEESAGTQDMTAEDAAAAVSITVGSYNVWAPSARKSVMDADATVSLQRSWANSYESVAAMINALDCDVIGIQEVTKMVYQTTLTTGNEDYDGNVHTLNSLLPNYSWVIYNAANTTYDNLTNNTTANGLGSTDAILYKSSVLTLVSKGRYWLTGTRKKAPQDDASWDRIGSNRPATWAKFTHKASGKQFVFITTHLDLPNAGEESDPAMPQRRNATELITWFAPLVTEDLPSIITGDMNVETGDAAGNYDILVSGRWKDVYDTMREDGSLAPLERAVKGTMNANKNEEGGLSSWRPDHVFTYGFTPSYYRVGREQLPTKDGSLHWPSDHLPVKVIINF